MEKRKGLHKGAKGQSYKKKDKNNKIKTKSKTVNKNLDKRRSKIAIAKATKTILNQHIEDFHHPKRTVTINDIINSVFEGKIKFPKTKG